MHTCVWYESTWESAKKTWTLVKNLMGTCVLYKIWLPIVSLKKIQPIHSSFPIGSTLLEMHFRRCTENVHAKWIIPLKWPALVSYSSSIYPDLVERKASCHRGSMLQKLMAKTIYSGHVILMRRGKRPHMKSSKAGCKPRSM